MKKFSSLKEDFAQRSLWVNYRSSAVFPFFLGEHEDTILVFQNYWLWKSNIKNVIANIYIRDSSGTLAFSESIDIKSHNEISIKKLIYGGIKLNSGTIEIELIANNKSIAEIQEAIGADHLIYQDLDGLIRAVSHDNSSITGFDDSCFSGKYITDDITVEYLEKLESTRSDGAKKRKV